MKAKPNHLKRILFLMPTFLKTITRKNGGKFQNALYGFFVLLLLFSCEANIEEELITQDDASCNPDVSFALSIKPIIDNNCLQCHGGTQSPNLSSYAGISANADRIKTQVVSGRMPQGGSLTTEEIQLISCWVDNGALNN